MQLSAELFEQIVDALRSDSNSDKDKRTEPRVGMAGEARVVSLRADQKPQTTKVRVRDVSRSGVGLSHNARCSKEQKLVLQLQSIHGEPIWLLCITAYCRRQQDDRFSVGARISKVLRAAQVQKLETEKGALEELLGAVKTEPPAPAVKSTEQTEINRLAKVILS